jgi:hypothetical protein
MSGGLTPRPQGIQEGLDALKGVMRIYVLLDVVHYSPFWDR